VGVCKPSACKWGLECSRQPVSIDRSFCFHCRPSPCMHLQESPQTSPVLARSVAKFAFVFLVFAEIDSALYVGESPASAPTLMTVAVRKDIALGQRRAHLTSSAPSRWLPGFLSPACAGARVTGGAMALHLLCLLICQLATQRFEGKQGQFGAPFPQRPGK